MKWGTTFEFFFNFKDNSDLELYFFYVFFVPFISCIFIPLILYTFISILFGSIFF